MLYINVIIHLLTVLDKNQVDKDILSSHGEIWYLMLAITQGISNRHWRLFNEERKNLTWFWEVLHNQAWFYVS